MKRWIATVSAAVLLAGCQTSVKQVKEDAQVRWQQTRARVTYGVALEQFNAGQVDRAASKVLEALSLAPNDPECRLLLGRIYIEQGRYPSAVVELKRAAEQLPKSFEAAFMLGVAQEKAGHLDDALASYHKALDLDSFSVHAIMAVAEVMVAVGQVGEAQVFADSHMALAGDEPGMYELAGRLAMMLEDYPHAARNCSQAVDLAPANARYREAFGQALFLSRQYSEAVEAVRALMRLPGYTAPAWVLTMLGDCQMALSQPREARQAYESARKLAPEDSRNWTNVAKAALALGDAAGTVAAAQEALRQEPRALDASLLLGYALLKEEQAEKAVKVLAGAVEKFPDHIVLRCLLGKAYAARGDSAQAVRCYTAALKMGPDNPLPKELLAASAGRAPAREE